MSAIKIHEDGLYTCSVSIDSEGKVLFPQVSVTIPDLKDTGQVKSLSVNYTQTIKPEMEPISAIFPKSSTPLLVSKDKQLSFQTQSEQLFSYVVVSESEYKVESCFEPCLSRKSSALMPVSTDSKEEQITLQTKRKDTFSPLPETEKREEQKVLEPYSAVFFKVSCSITCIHT